MRSLTAWLDDGYCSITVANHQLITVIRFIERSYIHPWKAFAKRLYLARYICKIPFYKIQEEANQTRPIFSSKKLNPANYCQAIISVARGRLAGTHLSIDIKFYLGSCPLP